jgi:HEPN domain-containing protein
VADNVKEWFDQADYDLETVRYMLDGGRRSYAVFMAHLAVEKALKGLYQHRLKKAPPRTHDLVLLINRCGIQIAETEEHFLRSLTETQIAARYPIQFSKQSQRFSQEVSATIVGQAQETLQWAKTLL